MLVGALVGQITQTPALTVLGGISSHLVLDAVPHTEGETFGLDLRPGFRWDLAEAALEVLAGTAFLAWLIRACPMVAPFPIVFGAAAGLFPDVVEAMCFRWLGRTVLHPLRLHWTVSRRHWRAGVITQIAVIAAAAILLWRLSGCG